MSHTVTITQLPDESSDDYEYAFGGTHGADCEVYVECKRKACQAMNPDYGDERVRHGKQHFHRDGDWLVESDICALRYVFEYIGPIETFSEAEVVLGTYPVIVAWEDGSWCLEIQNRTPDDENGPWDRRDGCFGHCDPEGWYAPCRDYENGSE